MQKSKLLKITNLTTYFLMGTCYVLVGSIIVQLMQQFDKPLKVVVLFSSAFALGRIAFIYLVVFLSKKLQTPVIMALGALAFMVYLFFMPLTTTYFIGMLLAFIGGGGMGIICITGPELITISFGERRTMAFSAGQSILGLGMFFTPFLTTFVLKFDLSYKLVFYVLFVIATLTFIAAVIISKRWVATTEEVEVKVEPIKTDKKRLVFGLLLLLSIMFSVVASVIVSYTVKFLMSKGLTNSDATFGLTLYNMGCVLGGIIFVFILRKIKQKYVLASNFLVVTLAVLFLCFSKGQLLTYILLIIAGIHLEVILGPVTDMGMRVMYDNTVLANSYIAGIGGVAEMITPIITAGIVATFSVQATFIYATVAALIATLAATSILLILRKQK